MRPDKIPRQQVIVRMPVEVHEVLYKASFYGKISMNQLVCDAVDARLKFIEKKYIKDLDRK